MKNVLMLPAIFEGGRDLKDKTKKITFVTNEITPKQAGDLQQCISEFVYLAIKLEPFTREEIDIIQDLKSDIDGFGKTHSQRLRGVLYRLWEQDNAGYDDFNLYYAFKMEGIIGVMKCKLI